MVLVRLGGFWAAPLYTSVEGYRFPQPSGDQMGFGWCPSVCGGVEENRQRRFNSQLSAVSNELLAKATAVLDGIRPTLGDETAKDGDTRGFGGGGSRVVG